MQVLLDEQLDRNKRRNNAIITGMSVEGMSNPDLKTTLENLFAQMLRRHAEIRNVTIKRDRVIVVQFEKLIDKIDVLRNRYNYIGKAMGITIFPDETPRERRMIDEIKRRSMEETIKGNLVKMSYRSIFVNEKKFVWSELQDKLVEAVNRPRTASVPCECGKRPQNARADSRSYRTAFFIHPHFLQSQFRVSEHLAVTIFIQTPSILNTINFDCKSPKAMLQIEFTSHSFLAIAFIKKSISRNTSRSGGIQVPCSAIYSNGNRNPARAKSVFSSFPPSNVGV